MGKVYEKIIWQHVRATTKDIDVRAHFIRELEDNNYLNVQFNDGKKMQQTYH